VPDVRFAIRGFHLDEYILFSKNGEGSFEVKIPFSADSLNQVSDLLTKEGLIIRKGEIEKLCSSLEELKSMLADMKRESELSNRLIQDVLRRGLKENESGDDRVPAPSVQLGPETRDAELPEDKISMLPSPKTKAFELISRLGNQHMDKEFTTANLTLYEKRVFSLLVKRYEFVRKVRKEGRSIVYQFTERALDSICKELGGTTSISVSSRVRSRNLEEFMDKMKERYPHFSYSSVQSRSAYKQYKLLFSDKSVKKSVVDNLTRMFGPTGIRVS